MVDSRQLHHNSNSSHKRKVDEVYVTELLAKTEDTVNKHVSVLGEILNSDVMPAMVSLRDSVQSVKAAQTDLRNGIGSVEEKVNSVPKSQQGLEWGKRDLSNMKTQMEELKNSICSLQSHGSSFGNGWDSVLP